MVFMVIVLFLLFLSLFALFWALHPETVSARRAQVVNSTFFMDRFSFGSPFCDKGKKYFPIKQISKGKYFEKNPPFLAKEKGQVV